MIDWIPFAFFTAEKIIQIIYFFHLWDFLLNQLKNINKMIFFSFRVLWTWCLIVYNSRPGGKLPKILSLLDFECISMILWIFLIDWDTWYFDEMTFEHFCVFWRVCKGSFIRDVRLKCNFRPPLLPFRYFKGFIASTYGFDGNLWIPANLAILCERPLAKTAWKAFELHRSHNDSVKKSKVIHQLHFLLKYEARFQSKYSYPTLNFLLVTQTDPPSNTIAAIKSFKILLIYVHIQQLFFMHFFSWIFYFKIYRF